MVSAIYWFMGAAWRVLLACLGICLHSDRYRERDDAGVLRLVCEQCGDAVAAITREANWQPSGVMPVQVKRSQKVMATVTQMRREAK
jgi:hypothetical protein